MRCFIYYVLKSGSSYKVGAPPHHQPNQNRYIGQLGEYAHIHHFDIFTAYGDASIKADGKPCQIIRCIKEQYGAVYSGILTHRFVSEQATKAYVYVR